MQAALATIGTYPAAALWHAIDGVHVDQSAQVLWHLKLATS